MGAQSVFPAGRVQLLALGLGLTGVLLALPFASSAPVSDDVSLPGLVMVPIFALAGLFVVYLRLGREAHDISLRDLAVVLGLATVSPLAYVFAHVLGSLLPVVVRGMRGQKLVFNTGLMLAEAGLATVVYRSLLQEGDALGLRGVLAAFAAVIAIDVLAATAVTAAIALHTGQTERLSPQVLVLSLAAAPAGASVALLTLVLLVDRPGALPLLAGLLLVLLSVYRNQVRLVADNDRLEVLYAVTRTAGRALADDRVEGAVLIEARRVLQAERLELHLLPEGDDPGRSVCAVAGSDGDVIAPGPLVRRDWWTEALKGEVVRRAAGDSSDGPADALAVPLHRDGKVCGVLTAVDRMGQGAVFTRADGQVFAALAGTVSVSLRNGDLVRRLRQEAARREHELRHDPLTGLLSRQGLVERLDATGSAHVLLCLELGELHEVRDGLGYEVADALLVSASCRLAAAFPQGQLARLGDAELALLITGADRDAVAHRVRACLAEPFEASGLRLPLHAVLGSLLLPQDDADGTVLLRRAELARSRAARDLVAHAGYDPADEVASRERLALVGDLDEALRSSGVSTVYQPQLDLRSGRVLGVEALVRWAHPRLGAVPPDRFVPLAEQSGLIDGLTDLVLTTALADAARWRSLGLLDGVSVNLSAVTVATPGLAASLARALDLAGLPPAALTLELTETAVIADPQRAAAVLAELAELGVALSLDDFGTGYSSLSLLRSLPLHEVKVDRSFVSRMCTDSGDSAIVRSTLMLARELGLRTVAEGVEDPATLEALVELGCDVAQGYWISRPLAAPALTGWLELRGGPATCRRPPQPRRAHLRLDPDRGGSQERIRSTAKDIVSGQGSRMPGREPGR